MSVFSLHADYPATMAPQLRTSLIACFAGMPFAAAETLALPLEGTTSADVWDAGSLSTTANPGFPGATTYAQPWPSSIPTSNGGDAFLSKLANGPTGAPIPSGQSIYFVSFFNTANTFGGTLGVHDDTPLASLNTIAFQLEIGGANGYDLYNNHLAGPPDLSAVKLHYTTTGGATGTLQADSHAILDRFYTFAIDMPTGPNGEDQPEDIYNRLYGLQWDLSGIGPVSEFHIEFSGVEHAQLYQLRLDQSSHTYGTTSVFPRDAVWTDGGGDLSWNTTANWNESSPPGPGRNIRFSAGIGTSLDDTLTAKSLNFSSSSSFALGGTSPSVTLTSGINADSPGAVSHLLSLPLHFANYNLIELAAGNTLTLTGPITGSGFYKQGSGNLILSGNNLYDGTDSSFQINGLILRGGDVTVTGTNAISPGASSSTLNIRPDTTVRLVGGDDRFDPKFTANLLGSTSILVLGGASGKSDQTFAGLTGSVSGTPVTGSRIVGGSSSFSTLTINPSGTAIYAGNIGGSGEFENHLNLLKTGSGLQFLSGLNTYTGTTRIDAGALALDPTGRTIVLNGGALVLDGADLSAILGDQPGGISFTSHGGFAANGNAPHSITLDSGVPLSWASDSFLPDNRRLLLSAAGTNQTIDFTNPLDLGTGTRVIHVEDGSHNTDARLSGSLGGSGILAKTGPGHLEITAANPFSGTAIVHSGTFSVTGGSGTFAGQLAANPGTFLRLTNATGAKLDNRLPSSTSVALRGAFFTFTAASDGNQESIGQLGIEQGANTVSTSRSSAGSSTVLTFASLGRLPSSTLNFSGTSIGVADARNQVRFTTPPPLNQGIIGGWAVTGNEFATLGPLGVIAFENYSTSAESAWDASHNVKLTAGAASSPTAILTASREIHSLRLVGATSGTFGNVLDLGGNSLLVRSGGILVNGGSDTRTAKITNGSLTASNELILFSNGPLDISATVADPSPSQSLSLVKSGSGLLTLQAPAAHTGSTVVNQGTLRLASSASLASSPHIRLISGGTLNVSEHAAFTIAPGQTLSGTGTVNGSLSIGGTLAPDASAQTPLAITGQLTFASGSSVGITIGPSDALPLHGSVNVSGTVSVSPGTRLSIDTDTTSPFWNEPRSFTILSAASFSETPVFTIEGGPEHGLWHLSASATSVVLGWTPATPLQLWRKARFGTFENTGDAADAGDPDHDGVPNLVEYALGTSPLAFSAKPAPGPNRTLDFSLPDPPAPDVACEVQSSADLSVWKTIATFTPAAGWTWTGEGPSQITLTPASGSVGISVGGETVPSVPDRRFMRLKAIHP